MYGSLSLVSEHRRITGDVLLEVVNVRRIECRGQAGASGYYQQRVWRTNRCFRFWRRTCAVGKDSTVLIVSNRNVPAECTPLIVVYYYRRFVFPFHGRYYNSTVIAPRYRLRDFHGKQTDNRPCKTFLTCENHRYRNNAVEKEARCSPIRPCRIGRQWENVPGRRKERIYVACV